MNSKLMYDCHIHYYGDEADTLRRLVEKSEYASRYMCYHSINYSMIEEENTVDEKICYFMMPFAIKETNIIEANRRFKKFSKGHSNIMQIPLLGDDMKNYEAFDRLIGLKEHFLLHEMGDVSKRAPYYEYLDTHRKLLLLHCRDTGRLEYIEELRRNYPNMYIQVAHLGVSRKNIKDTRPLLERFAGDDHIYYDTSTVYDFDFITEYYQLIREQILYGTDCPYVSEDNIEKQMDFLENCGGLIEQMNRNGEKLLKIVK